MWHDSFMVNEAGKEEVFHKPPVEASRAVMREALKKYQDWEKGHSHILGVDAGRIGADTDYMNGLSAFDRSYFKTDFRERRENFREAEQFWKQAAQDSEYIAISRATAIASLFQEDPKVFSPYIFDAARLTAKMLNYNEPEMAIECWENCVEKPVADGLVAEPVTSGEGFGNLKSEINARREFILARKILKEINFEQRLENSYGRLKKIPRVQKILRDSLERLGAVKSYWEKLPETWRQGLIYEALEKGGGGNNVSNFGELMMKIERALPNPEDCLREAEIVLEKPIYTMNGEKISKKWDTGGMYYKADSFLEAASIWKKEAETLGREDLENVAFMANLLGKIFGLSLPTEEFEEVKRRMELATKAINGGAGDYANYTLSELGEKYPSLKELDSYVKLMERANVRKVSPIGNYGKGDGNIR